jgi:hypothetical protein
VPLVVQSQLVSNDPSLYMVALYSYIIVDCNQTFCPQIVTLFSIIELTAIKIKLSRDYKVYPESNVALLLLTYSESWNKSFPSCTSILY